MARYQGSDDTGSLKEAKAFCEGRKAQVDGGSVGDDPFPANSAESAAWVLGFNEALNGDDVQSCAQ